MRHGADETDVAGRLLEEALPPGVWAHGALILHSAITRRRCFFHLRRPRGPQVWRAHAIKRAPFA